MIDKSQTKQDKQIDLFVLGFVQLWENFENTLSSELIKKHQTKDSVRDESHGNTNYGLFYRVSSRLSHGENLTMGELSKFLSVPLSTATRIVDYLVERCYIQRLPDPEDRRVVRVKLTATGLEIHRTIDNHVKQRVRQFLSCLDNEERDSLFNLLGNVVSANQSGNT